MFDSESSRDSGISQRTQEGIAMRLQPGSEKEWVKNMNGILNRMKSAKDGFVPVPLIVDTDQFHLQFLHIRHDIARLLVLYHGCWEARSSFPTAPVVRPVHAQGRQVAAAVLSAPVSTLSTSSSLSTPYSLPTSHLGTSSGLPTTPGAPFTAVAFAAGIIIGGNLLVPRIAPSRVYADVHSLFGTSDALIAKTVKHLSKAACGTGCAAERTALLVERPARKWEASGEEEPPLAPAEERAGGSDVQQSSAPGSEVPSFGDGSGGFVFSDAMLQDDAAFWDLLAADQMW
ncbi:hypothetical protein C8R43DRAFT_1118297 [Mycena crocata]|nr:hypothetical protein C8R43DRAFT_1118297 [Mycena crocata]